MAPLDFAMDDRLADDAPIEPETATVFGWALIDPAQVAWPLMPGRFVPLPTLREQASKTFVLTKPAVLYEVRGDVRA